MRISRNPLFDKFGNWVGNCWQMVAYLYKGWIVSVQGKSISQCARKCHLSNLRNRANPKSRRDRILFLKSKILR